MITLALICLVIALLAGAFGFTGLSASAIGLAKFLVLLKIVSVLFLLACIGFFAFHLFGRRHAHP